MHRTLIEIKNTLWAFLIEQNNTNDLLQILRTCHIRYDDTLLTNYTISIYGANSNKFSYPNGIRIFELLHSKEKRTIAHIINLYNKQIYYTIILSQSGSVLIAEKKSDADIYLNGELSGHLTKEKNKMIVSNTEKKLAIIDYPKWWQFKRLGNIHIDNKTIPFDTLSPNDSVIKDQLQTNNNSDLYMIIAGVFHRTTKSLSV